MVHFGFRLANGSWNTGWMRARWAAVRFARGGRGLPCHTTVPFCMGPRPAIARPKVDLPDPDPPTKAKVSPAHKARAASSTATKSGARQPLRGKRTVTPCADSNTGASSGKGAVSIGESSRGVAASKARA